jgi:hypothetical protein
LRVLFARALMFSICLTPEAVSGNLFEGTWRIAPIAI